MATLLRVLLVVCAVLVVFTVPAPVSAVPSATPARLVVAIASATPIQLTPFNDGLVFGVRRPISEFTDGDGFVHQVLPPPDDELWTSDGTPSGTHRTATITSDDSITYARLQQIVRVQQTLFLRIHPNALYGAHEIPGGELWRSDGTAAGTTRIERLNIHAQQEVQEIGSANNALFVGGATLWHATDVVTEPLTFAALHDFPCTTAYFGCTSSLRSLISVGNTLFFVVNDRAQPALWASDGTPDGTHLIKAFVPTTCSGLEQLMYACQAEPYDLTAANGHLYFIANDGNGNALWQSDGTTAGTVPATPLPLPVGVLPHHLAPVPGSNTLLFTANTPETGVELWMSDGTATGTRLVQDINPGAASANPGALTIVGNALFFTADDGSHGVGLWSVPLGPQGEAMTFTSPSNVGVNGTLAGRALPGTALTYRISTSPAHGTVTITDVATGAFTYTPLPDFRGTDSFQFSVNDSAPATVTISVGNYRAFVPLVLR